MTARAVSVRESHRIIVSATHRIRLPNKEREIPAHDLLARQTLDESLPPNDRQLDTAVHLCIAHHGLWIAAAIERLQIVEEALAHHDDAAVAATEMLALTVGDRALSDPADEILVHDVAGDPAASLLVGDR